MKPRIELDMVQIAELSLNLAIGAGICGGELNYTQRVYAEMLQRIT